jgi:choline kinase
MKAIILAAGRGSRMKELTDGRPKCLIEFRGKSLLEWQIEAIQEAGITEVAIVTGYKRDLLANRGLVEFHNPLWAETNMVSSLECAQDWLRNDTCIVSYSDIFYAHSAILSLMQCDEDIAITFDPKWLELWRRRFDDPLLDAESFKLNEDSTLKEIGNKPRAVEEIQGQYMGLLRLSPAGWTEIMRIRSELTQEDRDRMHMTGTLQRVIDSMQIKVRALPYEGDWGEFDSVTDFSPYGPTF